MTSFTLCPAGRAVARDSVDAVLLKCVFSNMYTALKRERTVA